MDLALNNLQWLMYHKTKQNKTKQNNGFLQGSQHGPMFFLNIYK